MTPIDPVYLRAVTADTEAAPSNPWNGVTAPSRRGGSGRFLTDVLVDLGSVDADRVARAVEESRSAGRPPEQVLLEAHAITPEQLSRAIAERHGLDHIDLGVFDVDMTAANLLNASAAKRYGAVPVAYVDDHTLLLAMADPANVLAVDDITLLTRLDIRPAVASAEDIRGLITRLDRFADAVQEAVEESEDDAAPLEIVDLRESAEDAKAMDLAGVPAKGEVDAISKQDVADQLKARGLVVIDIAHKYRSKELNFELFARVRATHLAVATRQLATMVSSGMTILRALYVLESQTESKVLRETVRALRSDVEAGLLLSDALERHPKVFPPLYVAMVRAGETGGVLESALLRTADQLEKDASLRRRVL